MELKSLRRSYILLLKQVLHILRNFFTLQFYIADHHVCLGQLRVLSEETCLANYPRSIKFYIILNILGALENTVGLFLVMR